MGDPKYIETLAALYGVTFSNMTDQKQKQILLLLKQAMTKKEYKLMFALKELPEAEQMAQLKCDSQAFELLKRKAMRKLKESKLQNLIIEIAETETLNQDN